MFQYIYVLHNSDSYLGQLDAWNRQNVKTTYVSLLQEISLYSARHNLSLLVRKRIADHYDQHIQSL